MGDFVPDRTCRELQKLIRDIPSRSLSEEEHNTLESHLSLGCLGCCGVYDDVIMDVK